MDIVLFGIQGSGKGTQAKIIAEKFNCKVCEMGAQLRELAKEDSELGIKVKTLIEAGHLVPADVILEIVENFVKGLSANDIALFDGIPRNENQKIRFDEVMKKYQRDFIGIQIEIPEEETIKRLLSRGRNDDNVDSIKNRIHHFNTETLPIIEDYKNLNKIVSINGFQSVDEVSKDIITVLEKNI